MWRFPGHFFSGAVVSPGFVAFSGTFSFWRSFPPRFRVFSGTFSSRHRSFSRFCGVFRDIFFCVVISSTYSGVFQDIFLPAPGFLPVLWCFPGHFFSRAMVSPGFVAFPRTFSFVCAFPPRSGGEMWMFCRCERFSFSVGKIYLFLWHYETDFYDIRCGGNDVCRLYTGQGGGKTCY